VKEAPFAAGKCACNSVPVMRTLRWVLGAAAVALGCGGRSVDQLPPEGAGATAGGSGASGSTGASGSAGASGSSGASGSTGASGKGGAGGSGGSAGATGGVSGAGGQAGSSFTGTRSVTLETQEFTLAPGEEAFKCQTFMNPFGVDVDVLRSESVMAPGSHHLIAFFDSMNRNGSVYDCGGLEFGERVHGAQVPEYVREYPEGVGLRMNASEGLRFNMHYLNTSGAELRARVKLTILAAPAGTAKYPAGFLFLNNAGIDVGPRAKGTATKTCTIPSDVQIMDLVSHMHMHATHIVAKTSSGRLVYEGTEWDHPKPSIFTPPLALGTDTHITWTCSYDNQGDTRLTFGESAATNEMCILGGTFYPAMQRSFTCL
jgi:hypothetical protein